MKRYAVIDIGSNTEVLVIYDVFEDMTFRTVKYLSEAVHLVSYIKDGHMEEEGISRTVETVKNYLKECRVHMVKEVHADITEPGRNIDNADALINAVKEAGCDSVTLLTGKEEAECDYYGASSEGHVCSLMMDIGGGSTEFVCSDNGIMKEAVSIPLGCVRLNRLKKTPDVSLERIEEMRRVFPEFKDTSEMTGIGGTIRAARDVCNALYHTGDEIHVMDLEDLYEMLQRNDAAYEKYVEGNVTKDRQPVFLAGLGMLVAACRSFKVNTIYVSDYGVREGFLLHHILKAV